MVKTHLLDNEVYVSTILYHALTRNSLPGLTLVLFISNSKNGNVQSLWLRSYERMINTNRICANSIRMIE